MVDKTKLPFAVGYAKQISIPWEADRLDNAYGVETANGWVQSCYSLVEKPEFATDMATLQGVWIMDCGILQWTAEGNLLLQASQTYDAVCDETFNYVQVVSTPQGHMILTDLGVWLLDSEQTWATKTNLPPFVKAVVHNGRCFAVTGTDTKLYFSALHQYDCFDSALGGGWLNFDARGGKCLALCQISGNLYVFRQHSIERIFATADQRDFVHTAVDFSCGNLYANTMASNGSQAMFLTDWGLWAFDGKAFSRVAKHLDTKFAKFNDYATGTFCNQGYVVHCKLHLDGTKANANFVNNSLVVVSPRGVVVLYGWDFTSLVTTESNQLLATSGGTVYTLDGQVDANGTSQCQLQTNFNSHKGKTVQFVTFTTQSPLTMTVHFNNTHKSYNLQASDQPQSIFVNATGKNFRFVFSTQGPMKLSPICVDYLLYKGGVAP